MRKGLWKYLGLYGVLILASLPLLFRQVPPNRFFGFRLPGAILFPSRWYDINALGGGMFIVSMLLCAALNLLLFRREFERAQPYLGGINATLIVLSFWIVSQLLVQSLP